MLTMNKNIIEISNLSKIYKDANTEVTALYNIELTIKKGESVAIVGPSGSGKTTLLEIMGGLNFPTSGKVLIDGIDINQCSDDEKSKLRNKTIGFVFQMMYLQDYFNAVENVQLPLIADNSDFNSSKDKATKLLEDIELKERMNFYPKQLSGGEMQRVAIARALANNPKLILADEPTAKLDRVNSDKVMQILMNTAKKGVSVVLITHDEKVANLFDRVIYMEHGSIIKNKLIKNRNEI